MALVETKAHVKAAMRIALWITLFFSLLWLIIWLWQEPTSRQQDMEIWPDIAVEEIVKVVIRKQSSDQLVLQLVEGHWRLVNGDLAVQDAVQHLLADLVGMLPIRVVTRKHEYDAELGMQDRAVWVQCLNGKGELVLDLVVGKQGSDLLSTYVRRVGDDAVVAVNRALVWQVKRSNRAWKSVEK